MRLLGALRGALLLGVLGALLGLFDALRAGGPEPFVRILPGLALLNALLISPIGGLLGLFFPLRSRGWSLGLLALTAALLLWGAVAAGRLTRDLGPLAQAWLRAQPLPPLRVDPGEGPGPVILISLDTVRADALAQMPRLKARSASGLRYTQAYSPSSWTLPAMASVMSGLPAWEHGAGRRVDGAPTHVRSALPEDPLVLAEALFDRGYISAAVLSNPYLGPRHGMTRGFDRVWQLSEQRAFREGLRRSSLLRPWLPAASDDAAAVSARAVQALGQLGEGRFFLWIHQIEAHAPYGQTQDVCALPSCWNDWAAVRRGERDYDAAQVQALYAQDLERLDQGLESLFQELDQQGLWARALVIVLADHGESFGEHGAVEHGSGLWDEQVRVPLVVWAPGVQGEIDQAVSLVGLHDAVLGWVSQRQWVMPSGPVQLAGTLFGPELSGCVVDGVKLLQQSNTLLGPSDQPIEAGTPPLCDAEPLGSASQGIDTWQALSVLGYTE